jgi:gluconolactonase
MKHPIVFAPLFALLCCTRSEPAKTPPPTPTPVYPTTGSIERLDPALDALIAPDAKIEILADTFLWSEGPLWVASLQALLFSDVPANTIYKWKETEGKSVYLKPSGYTGAGEYSNEPGANGLTLDPEGRLVICQHGDRRVARLDAPWDKPAPNFVTLADKCGGKRFNSPNDAVFHPNGDLYFTDPPYGLPKQEHDPSREINIQGVYRLGKDGKATLLTDELSRPNGLCFSPDGKKLYVANSDPARAVVMVYPVKTDGTLDKGAVFFDATPLTTAAPGLPDGLRCDAAGNLFATGPGGVLVFNADGKHLGTIKTGQATANCAFDDTGKTLYMTADMFLMRVVLKK